MKTSVIIVNYKTKKMTEECIRSLIKNTKDITYEIIVVDNASNDGSIEYLESKLGRKIKILKSSKNLGFGYANNLAMKKTKGKYLLLLNSDTIIQDNVIGEMSSWMDKHPKVGVSSCKLYGKDGNIQENGGYFPSLVRVFSWMVIQDLPLIDKIIKPFHPLKPKSFTKEHKFYSVSRDVDWVTGAFFLMRYKIVQQVGNFDTGYFMYTEEVDYCYRIKSAGWKVKYIPKWSIIHLGGASSTREFSILNEIKGIKRFYKKHYPAWQYPLLRTILKIGMAGRMFLFGILEGKESFNIYAKAFRIA